MVVFAEIPPFLGNYFQVILLGFYLCFVYIYIRVTEERAVVGHPAFRHHLCPL